MGRTTRQKINKEREDSSNVFMQSYVFVNFGKIIDLSENPLRSSFFTL